MSDTASTTAPRVKKPTPPVSAEGFAELVTGMSRFLSKLATYAPFEESNVGLAEWSLMNRLAESTGSNRGLTKELGVSKQRVTQLTDSLKAAGLITMAQVEGDARQNSITLTDAGKEQLQAINGKLTPLLIEAFGEKAKVMHSATKSMKVLTRVVTAPKTPKADRAEKAERPAKADRAPAKKSGAGAKKTAS